MEEGPSNGSCLRGHAGVSSFSPNALGVQQNLLEKELPFQENTRTRHAQKHSPCCACSRLVIDNVLWNQKQKQETAGQGDLRFSTQGASS
jgi:hypothetical protein